MTRLSKHLLTTADRRLLADLAERLALDCGEIPDRFKVGTAAAARIMHAQLERVRAAGGGPIEPATSFSVADIVAAAHKDEAHS